MNRVNVVAVKVISPQSRVASVGGAHSIRDTGPAHQALADDGVNGTGYQEGPQNKGGDFNDFIDRRVLMAPTIKSLAW